MWGLWSCRIEAKGKGFLQPHQLIDEFEAIPEASRKNLLESEFGEVLKNTQVKPYKLSLVFTYFRVYVVNIWL